MAGELAPIAASKYCAAAAAERVGSIDDLLIEILLRLPLKSLVRVELVSREWHSLITKTVIPLKNSKQNNTPAGLIVFKPGGVDKTATIYLSFSNLSTTSTSFSTPLENLLNATTTSGRDWYEIHTSTSRCLYQIRTQSSNGLLLICNKQIIYHSRVHRRFSSVTLTNYVCNPTTNKIFALPRVRDCDNEDWTQMWLAFDPVKSSYYKVVAIKKGEFITSGGGVGNPGATYQIYIYSSDSREWRPSGQPVTKERPSGKGVYWNGNIHWVHGIERGADCSYFDMENEIVKEMPRLPIVFTTSGYFPSYCGESRDHLHFVKVDRTLQLHVYELRRDYSEWFIKFHVDLSTFPPCIDIPVTHGWPPDIDLKALIRGEDDSDCFLIYDTSREVVIRYNIVTKASETLKELTARLRDRTFWLNWSPCQYIESLCAV